MRLDVVGGDHLNTVLHAVVLEFMFHQNPGISCRNILLELKLGSLTDFHLESLVRLREQDGILSCLNLLRIHLRSGTFADLDRHWIQNVAILYVLCLTKDFSVN